MDINADHEDIDILKRFNRELESCTMTATSGRKIRRVERLQKWLRSAHDGGEESRLSLLHQAAYRERDQPGFPVTAEKISDSGLLTFCILIRLGRPDAIAKFLELNIKDKNLPRPLQELERTLKEDNVSDWEQLAESFEAEQWSFFVPKFELGMYEKLHEGHILPIVERFELSKKGGTAKIWQIGVPEEFVDSRLRRKASHSVYGEDDDALGKRYQFVLKQFDSRRQNIFNNEKASFIALQNHEGMIQCYGSFRHREKPLTKEIYGTTSSSEKLGVVSTYNILLEYADYDLRDYFKLYQPPMIPNLLRKFWEDLLDVPRALREIHTRPVQKGEEHPYFGWHADIKPDNILLVREKFRLADPGFMKFVKKDDKEPTTILDGGTWTYGELGSEMSCLKLKILKGPPEHQPGSSRPVKRSVDIWSLACVFSIAATWIVFGEQGVRVFETVRRNALGRLAEDKEDALRGSFFHDGKNELPDVKGWHDMLRKSIRPMDNITEHILDLVDQEMLLQDPDKRISMKKLCFKLESIIDQAKMDDVFPVSSNILDTLEEYNREAPSGNSSTAAGYSEQQRNRQMRKSALKNIPVKRTSHRPANSHLLTLNTALYAADTSLNREPNPQTLHATSNSIENLLSGSSKAPGTKRRISSGPRKASSSTIAKHKPLDLFDVQRSVELEMAKKSKEWLSWLRTNPYALDGKLAEHYENRDIKFLIDNSESMMRHWSRLRLVLRALVKKAVGQDDDGMDLSFTCGKKNLNATEPDQFLECIESEDARPRQHRHTNMTVALSSPLEEYIDKASSNKENKQRNLTVIVLTDGVWKGTTNREKVREEIISFLTRLKEIKGEPLTGIPVSIEFVTFGDDMEGLLFLHELDEMLTWESHVDDIIDTERWDGDVYKMLLGSFVKDFDDIPSEAYSLGSPLKPNTPVFRRDSSVSL